MVKSLDEVLFFIKKILDNTIKTCYIRQIIDNTIEVFDLVSVNPRVTHLESGLESLSGRRN